MPPRPYSPLPPRIPHPPATSRWRGTRRPRAKLIVALIRRRATHRERGSARLHALRIDSPTLTGGSTQSGRSHRGAREAPRSTSLSTESSRRDSARVDLSTLGGKDDACGPSRRDGREARARQAPIGARLRAIFGTSRLVDLGPEGRPNAVVPVVMVGNARSTSSSRGELEGDIRHESIRRPWARRTTQERPLASDGRERALDKFQQGRARGDSAPVYSSTLGPKDDPRAATRITTFGRRRAPRVSARRARGETRHESTRRPWARRTAQCGALRRDVRQAPRSTSLSRRAPRYVCSRGSRRVRRRGAAEAVAALWKLAHDDVANADEDAPMFALRLADASSAPEQQSRCEVRGQGAGETPSAPQTFTVRRCRPSRIESSRSRPG